MTRQAWIEFEFNWIGLLLRAGSLQILLDPCATTNVQKNETGLLLVAVKADPPEFRPTAAGRGAS